MISPLRLEAPGHWRTLGLAGCFALAIAPAMPLAFAAVGSGPWDELLHRPQSALLRLFRNRVRGNVSEASDDGLA